MCLGSRNVDGILNKIIQYLLLGINCEACFKYIGPKCNFSVKYPIIVRDYTGRSHVQIVFRSRTSGHYLWATYQLRRYAWLHSSAWGGSCHSHLQSFATPPPRVAVRRWELSHRQRRFAVGALQMIGGDCGSSGWLDLNSVQIRHFSNRAVKQTGRN